MKRIFLMTLGIASFALSSFTNHTLPSFEVKPAAEPFIFKFVDNFSLDGHTSFNDCTGETIYLSGTAHLFFHGVFNPNNNTLKLQTHQNFQGAKGLSGTGVTYSVQFINNEAQFINFTGCEVKFRQKFAFRLLTKGADNNLFFNGTRLYTYNYCTGEMNIKEEEYVLECR